MSRGHFVLSSSDDWQRIAQGGTLENRMSVEINPILLRGPWRSGFALDLQTTSSVLIGTDSAGHKRFDTTRPPMGELLYRLKYGNDSTALGEIVETVVGFLRTWKVEVDGIVPVPASKVRKFQPLLEVAKALCERTGIPLRGEYVSKVKATSQLKDEADFNKKVEVLNSALTVDRSLAQGARILLLDDLYQTGATVDTITRKLLQDGGAAAVYLLTLTKSRR
jgi:competence protein ComFC